MKKLSHRAYARALAVLVAGGLTVSQAQAALSTAISDAITAAGTDLGLFYSAMTVVGAGLFVARLLYRKFTVR
jgi:hypothetical protein